MMSLQQAGRGTYSPKALDKMRRIIREKGPLTRVSLGGYHGGPSPTVLDKRLTRLVTLGEVEIDAKGIITWKAGVRRG